MHVHPLGNHACQWLQCCESWCVHAIGCEVPYQHFVVTELQNPVTRSLVQVVPPREISSKDQFDVLTHTFIEWCKNAWRDDRRDPKIYDEMPPEASGVR